MVSKKRGTPGAPRGPLKKLKTEVLLSDKERKVLDVYFQTLSATEACRANNVGSTQRADQYFYQLLKNKPSAILYLQDKMLAARNAGIVSAEELTRDLESMRNLSPWDFLDEHEEKGHRFLRLKSKEDIPRMSARWIKKIKTKTTYRYTTEFDGPNPKDVTLMDVVQEVEFHSVLDVIDKLARILGAYRDKAEVTGDGTLPTMFLPEKAGSVEEWETMVKEAQVIKVHGGQASGTRNSGHKN